MDCEKLVDNANLWAENQQLKKEIKSLKEELQNDIDRYEDSIFYQLGFDTGKEKYKQKVDKAVNRISLLKMDNDTSEETHKAIDYILKALLD